MSTWSTTGGRGFVAALVLAGLLAGCQNGSSRLENSVTGSQGGALPGMAVPASKPTGTNGTPKMKTADEKLPDGRWHRIQTFGEKPFAEFWYNPAGQPERAIYYGPGALPLSVSEWTAAGVPVQTTLYFEGTPMVQRHEEYDARGAMVRVTDFWLNGRSRTMTEIGVPTPAGPVTRVREWADNGQIIKLAQRDELGHYEGRQTTWSESGKVIFDSDYADGVLVHDYAGEELDQRNPVTSPLRPYADRMF
jgi:hypothetical protein